MILQWKLNLWIGHILFLVLPPCFGVWRHTCTHELQRQSTAFLKCWLFAWQGTLGKMSLPPGTKAFTVRSGAGRGDQVHSQVVWDTHPGHFRFLIFFFLSELFPAASRLSSTVSHGNADRKHPPYTCSCPLPFDNRQALFTDKTCSTSSVVIGG